MGKTSNGKSVYWFEHRSQSRNDVKILQLDEYLGEHIGYALFFKALELFAELPEPFLDKNSILHRKAMGLCQSEYKNFIDCAISSGLFDVADDGRVYSPGFIEWQRRRKINQDNGSKGGMATQAKLKANDQAKPQATAKAKEPKPVVKQSPTPESDQITRLRSYAKAIFDELGSSKNKPELTTEQYQKLIDKWGFDKLVVLQRIYYEWKASLAKKHTHTDFGTLNKKCWVHEKADKDDGCQEQYESGNTPTPDQIPNPPAGGWLYPFPKPKGFDEMEHYAKRDLLSKLMNEYLAGKEAANPKPVKAPEPPKEEVWKYDFPKPEHWDGMKQAAKDAYVARELMKEAQDVINSLPH